MKIKVNKEEYVSACNRILADKKLAEIEKMVALMDYSNKVKVVSDMELALNDYLRPKF